MLTGAGCSGNAPEAADVAGIYRLDSASEPLLRKKGFAAAPDSQIRLSADGTADIGSVPDAYIDPRGSGTGKLVSGSGRWYLEKVNADYGVTLEIGTGGTMPHALYHASSILIEGRAGHHRLKMVLGDPDTGEALDFYQSAS